MIPFSVAALQINSGTSLEENFSQIRSLAKSAKEAGAKLISLPENFSYFGSDSEKLRHLPQIASQSFAFLRSLSQELGIYVWGGGYPAVGKSIQHSRNRASLFSPSGEEVHRYDKIHLFDMTDLGDGAVYRESRSVEPGETELSIYQSPDFGNWGTAICYDLRFPELFRKLALLGADVLFLPAAFTKLTGTAHWEVLLRARAIENTCYVVASAQTGSHLGNRETFGHAMIIDPWGVVLADAGTEPGFAIAEVDPMKLTDIRKRMPSLQHGKTV